MTSLWRMHFLVPGQYLTEFVACQDFFYPNCHNFETPQDFACVTHKPIEQYSITRPFMLKGGNLHRKEYRTFLFTFTSYWPKVDTLFTFAKH